jgi:hypothetical protein
MCRRLPTFFLSLLGAATLECGGAAAAQVEIEPSDATGSRFRIVISGPISLATLFDFSRAVVDPRIAGTLAPSVELDSPGGSIPAAMAIGGFVRAGGLRTAVARRRKCDSACALILVAGIERSASAGSVRIHRPRYQAGQAGGDAHARARESYKVVLSRMRDYLRHMGPGDRLLEAMLAVPSGRLRALSHRELQAYGLAPAQQATTTVALRAARVVPSAGRMLESAGMGKQAKRARMTPSTPRQRLLQAIVSAGPPPGLWRASAHRARPRSASRRSTFRKAAHGPRHKTRSVRGRGRAPPAA